MEHVHDDGTVDVSDTREEENTSLNSRAQIHTMRVCSLANGECRLSGTNSKRGRIRAIQMLLYSCVPDFKDVPSYLWILCDQILACTRSRKHMHTDKVGVCVCLSLRAVPDIRKLCNALISMRVFRLMRSEHKMRLCFLNIYHTTSKCNGYTELSFFTFTWPNFCSFARCRWNRFGFRFGCCRFCCYFIACRCACACVWVCSRIHFTDLNLKWGYIWIVVIVAAPPWYFIGVAWHKNKEPYNTRCRLWIRFFVWIPYHCHFKIISMRELCRCSVFDVFHSLCLGHCCRFHTHTNANRYI